MADADIRALLDIQFNPDGSGIRYPTIAEYGQAIEQLKREDVALRLIARPVEPASPKPKPKPAELLERTIAAPVPARVVSLEHQVLRRHTLPPRYVPPKPVDSPRLQIYIRPTGNGPWNPVAGQDFPADQRELAEGHLALFRARQPGVEFVIIAE